MSTLSVESFEKTDNERLKFILSLNEQSDNVESGHLEYSDYSACSFCVT